MNKWFLIVAVALCAGVTFAQGKGKGQASERRKLGPNQYLQLKDMTPLGGESDYLAELDQENANGEVKIKHDGNANFKKFDADGWHYFEVAYHVEPVGTDGDGKPTPVFVIPEVEITYALLYDMTKSKFFKGICNGAKKLKATAIVGVEDYSKQKYALFEETVTYTTILGNKLHYAAVCVPRAAVAAYGEPILFSVQIKVDGVVQKYLHGGEVQEIMTKATPQAKVGDRNLDALYLVDKKYTPWWERIRNLSEEVVKVDGILRDRSLTPFITTGDDYYDQVKQR